MHTVGSSGPQRAEGAEHLPGHLHAHPSRIARAGPQSGVGAAVAPVAPDRHRRRRPPAPPVGARCARRGVVRRRRHRQRAGVRVGFGPHAAVVAVRQPRAAYRSPSGAQPRGRSSLGLRPCAGHQEGLRREHQHEHDDSGPQDQQRQHLAAFAAPVPHDGTKSPVSALAPTGPGLPGRGDERGGAVTLLVMLMVPVCVLAAVTATAVPERLAAQAVADSAADSLAVLAVAWRDAQGRDHGRIGWFPPDCTPAPGRAADRSAEALGAELRDACEILTGSLLAGLGGRGFDESAVAGFYSSAYTTAALAAAPGDSHAASVPCRAASGAVTVDAAHLALAADWGAGGWATAQVWPDGITIRSEAIGRVTRPAPDAATGPADDGNALGRLPDCGDRLRYASDQPTRRLSDEALSLAEALPTRTAFGW